VWSDRQTFEKFAEERIGPITQEVGLPGPPETTFFEVHNYLTAGWRPFLVVTAQAAKARPR
jgi:hypothetical protein